MARIEKRLAKLEQAQSDKCYPIVVVDGKDVDENEDDEAILERECRKRGISRQAFDASGSRYVRVRFVEPKPR